VTPPPADEPACADAWYNLGWLRQRARDAPGAEAAYRQALALGITEPAMVHVNLATLFAGPLMRPESAEQALHDALAADPRCLPAWLNLGNLHEQQGRRDAARAAYDEALALQPGHALALARRLDLDAPDHAADPRLMAVRAALACPEASAADRADLGFALGRALDRLGVWDGAFAAFTAANAACGAMPGARRYDRAAHAAFVESVLNEPMAAGSEETGPPASSPRPIFIVGLFRSGSSLLEQILASHPAVTAGGELDLVPVLARRADVEPVDRLRQRYLKALAQRHPGADWVTDKRVDNFLHLGLIRRLFPDAPIVLTRRNALDNAVAVYFLHLGPAMPYARDLDDLAHWIAAHRRLMAHWQQRMGPALHTVQYETLVAQPRRTVLALLARLGLPWHDGCLDFHNRPALVQTPSTWQVRQALYSHAVGRWRPYEKHLAGLREALAGEV
jgi:tetratricopeptide (TPR) repeat protein